MNQSRSYKVLTGRTANKDEMVRRSSFDEAKLDGPSIDGYLIPVLKAFQRTSSDD
ncbi:hypothetical protein KHA80_02910 [Anaerobacillus sp. HL2]|nr:hypothetical protein KHA80_02910 [Anaerobacillus sp. HL2]